MIVLVTGATGFLGFRTLEKLVSDDRIERIIATGRSLKKTHEIRHPKINYILGDLSQKEFTESLFQFKIDYIIHTAALSSPWGKYEEFFKANIVPTQLLIDAFKKNSVKRFIYVSTPSLYFNKKHRWNIKESDPLPEKFINQYAATKREAEILLENSEIPFIGIRPRALTGRGDTVIMPRLIRAYQEGRLRIIGDGKNIVDITSVENVADVLHKSIYSSEKSLNQFYNITNDEPIELWKAIAMTLEQMGMQPPVKKLPYSLVVNIARFLEIKSKMTNGKEPALTCYGVGTLAKNFTMDISKAKELLGYEPKVNNEEAIAEFVKWYKTL